MSLILLSSALCAKRKKKSTPSLMDTGIQNSKHLKCPYHLKGKCAILIAWTDLSVRAIIV